MGRVNILRTHPDHAFTKLVAKGLNDSMQPLNVISLMVLYFIRKRSRANLQEVVESIHLENNRAAVAIDRLLEMGYIEAYGKGRGREYLLSAGVRRALNETIDYVQQTDIDRIRHPELVLKLAQGKKELSRNDVMKLLNLTPPQAYRLLKKMVEEDLLELHGTKSKVVYTLKHLKQRNPGGS